MQPDCMDPEKLCTMLLECERRRKELNIRAIATGCAVFQCCRVFGRGEKSCVIRAYEGRCFPKLEYNPRQSSEDRKEAKQLTLDARGPRFTSKYFKIENKYITTCHGVRGTMWWGLSFNLSLKFTSTTGWSTRDWPTGRSRMRGISCSLSCFSGPTPESKRSFPKIQGSTSK